MTPSDTTGLGQDRPLFSFPILYLFNGKGKGAVTQNPLAPKMSQNIVIWFGLVWLFLINVDLAIFQPYLDLEAGDKPISENSSGEEGNRTPKYCYIIKYLLTSVFYDYHNFFGWHINLSFHLNFNYTIN